jgi:hypothetical protein
MSHVDEMAQAWRTITLGSGGPAFAGVDADRQVLYRELVQNNLRGVLRRACPHAHRLGGDAFLRVADRFLAEHPIAARYTREIPGEFAAWLMTLPSTSLPDPSFAELCHFEALEIEVTLSPRSSHIVVERIAPATVPQMDASTRLAVYTHDVLSVTSHSSAWPAPLHQPAVVLCFQVHEQLVVERLSLATGKVLLTCAGGASVGDAVTHVVREGAAQGATVDSGAVMAQLTSLHQRGAISSFG